MGGGDGDWFADLSNWRDANDPTVTVPPPGAPADAAWIDNGTARVHSATIPGAPLTLGGLHIGRGGFGEVVSEVGVYSGLVDVGSTDDGSAEGIFDIAAGGLGTYQRIRVGSTSALTLGGSASGSGSLRVDGGIAGPDYADFFQSAIQIAYAKVEGGLAATATGDISVRSGDLTTGSIDVGRSVLNQTTAGAGSVANGHLHVAEGSVNVHHLDGAINVGLSERFASAFGPSSATGTMVVAGDFNASGLSNWMRIGYAAAYTPTSSLPEAPGLTQSASGSLIVHGTANLDISAIYSGSGFGKGLDVEGYVEFANANINTDAISVGATYYQSTGSVNGTLIIRDGTANLGIIRLAYAEATAVTSNTGLLVLGSDTTASHILMGDGAETRFLLRDDPADAGRLRFVPGDGNSALIDGDLSLEVLAAEDLELGDVFTLFDTDAGFTGGFDNVANGGTLASIDGGYLFTIHYGAESIYDANDVVAVVTAVPEPASALALLVLAALRRRTR